MPLHADQHGASRMAGDALLRAKEMGVLTDANIADATSVTSLQTNVTNASGHADTQPLRHRINDLLEIARADATLADATLQSQTTVAGAAALTQASTSRTAGGVE